MFAFVAIWPLLFTLPLLLSSKFSPTSYRDLFPSEWYATNDVGSPHPLGLTLGILAVGVAQVWLWIFFYLFKFGYFGSKPLSIQTKGEPQYDFWEGLRTHISQPEGFILLITYLSVTWRWRLLPDSYYSFDGTIQWSRTFLCLVVQDGFQFLMHLMEHAVLAAFYQLSHKPHHRFTNPRLFDAFNGSFADTICMIVFPLFATAQVMRDCNVWTYMAFGASYAGWLTLIHSEYPFPWDATFRALGFGTPADHHVHHKLFKYNFGHLFMWWDRLAGTYRDPTTLAPRVFRGSD